MLAKFSVCEAPVAVGRCQLWVEADSLVEFSDGLFQASLLCKVGSQPKLLFCDLGWEYHRTPFASEALTPYPLVKAPIGKSNSRVFLFPPWTVNESVRFPASSKNCSSYSPSSTPRLTRAFVSGRPSYTRSSRVLFHTMSNLGLEPQNDWVEVPLAERMLFVMSHSLPPSY